VFGEAMASAPPRGARSRERQQSNLQKDFYTPGPEAPYGNAKQLKGWQRSSWAIQLKAGID